MDYATKGCHCLLKGGSGRIPIGVVDGGPCAWECPRAGQCSILQTMTKAPRVERVMNRAKTKLRLMGFRT